MKTEIWCHSLNSTETASSVRLLHLSSLSSLTLASFMFAGRQDLTLGAGGGGSMVGNVPRLIPTAGSDTRWHHQTDPVGGICRDVYASKAASGKGVDVYLFLPHLRRVGWNSEKDENNAEWKFWVTVIVKPSGGEMKTLRTELSRHTHRHCSGNHRLHPADRWKVHLPCKFKGKIGTIWYLSPETVCLSLMRCGCFTVDCRLNCVVTSEWKPLCLIAYQALTWVQEASWTGAVEMEASSSAHEELVRKLIVRRRRKGNLFHNTDSSCEKCWSDF